MPDLYEVLQVHPRAESEVIRAAYRTLARKYHPDHGGDARRMIEINDAWDVLGDPRRRAAYDAERASAPAAVPNPEPPQQPVSTSTVSHAPADSHAGPPPGRPSGTVLDFGRYAGWSLGEIARQDLDYLEWLQRSTLGRRLRAEIDVLLAPRRRPGSSATSTASPWRGHR
ncbi:MAG: J domain-containing protein [Candidatus Limnocylindrales bacterium]